jgi:hypothetical protein
MARLLFLLLGTLIAAFFAFPFTAMAADIEKDLVLYLPLNEGQGDEVKDLSGSKFKTEMSPKKPKWVKADHPKIKNALEFDGKENFVKIDMAGQGKDFDSHVDEKKGLSICAWVKVLKTATDAHGQNRQPIVMKGAGGAWEFALYVYDGFQPGMSVWNCGGSGVSEPSGGNLEQGKWRYQCGTFKAKRGVEVYVDGNKAPVTQAPVNANIPCDGNRPVFIAHREDGQWLNAVIGEVRMWSRVIDVDEMNMAMNSIGGLAVNPLGKLATSWGAIKEER